MSRCSSSLLTPRTQNPLVPNLPLPQLRHRLLYSRQVKFVPFHNGPNTVKSGKIQHAFVNHPRRNNTRLDPQPIEQERQIRNLEFLILPHDRERVYRPRRRHGRKIQLPGDLQTARDDKMIHRCHILELLHLRIHNHEIRRPELHRVLSFALAAREHRDLAAPLRRELNRQMAQPPDSNHADTLRRLHAEHVEDVEHGGTAAHERACGFLGDAWWEFVSEGLAEDDVRGHGADVGPGEAVEAAAGTEGFEALEAAGAGFAAGSLVAEGDVVATFWGGN